MGYYFEGFYERAAKIRLVKSLLAAGAAGTLSAGVLILLWKLVLIPIEPIFSVLIGIGAALLVGGAVFLLARTSYASLAKRLDGDFDLRERVRTMLAYKGSKERIHVLQREDTERALSEIPESSLTARRLWIYVVAVCVGLAMLITGIAVPDGREVVIEDPVIPYELSPLQEAGLNELIAHVSGSDMKDPYKSAIISELEALLAALKLADTEAEMRSALSDSVSEITDITYDSSSMTEILNAMWLASGERIRALVTALDTSELDEPEWGAFADGYNEFKKVMTADPSGADGDDGASYAKWALEDLKIKIDSALLASGIKQGDPLYDALAKLVSSDVISGKGASAIKGLGAILSQIDSIDNAEAVKKIGDTVDAMAEVLYGASSELKINASTGEYVLRRISVLFGVKVPQFERPSLDDGGSSSDGDKEQDSSGGGVGEGVQFGSDDLVLDPITGKYVKYGELYSRYNTLMLERLSNDDYGYTEEQKRAIEKYFALLYSGLKEDK